MPLSLSDASKQDKCSMAFSVALTWGHLGVFPPKVATSPIALRIILATYGNASSSCCTYFLSSATDITSTSFGYARTVRRFPSLVTTEFHSPCLSTWYSHCETLIFSDGQSVHKTSAACNCRTFEQLDGDICGRNWHIISQWLADDCILLVCSVVGVGGFSFHAWANRRVVQSLRKDCAYDIIVNCVEFN